MYRIIGCIILAIRGLCIPPVALLVQHGHAIMQSIMQFIGQEQHLLGMAAVGGQASRMLGGRPGNHRGR